MHLFNHPFYHLHLYIHTESANLLNDLSYDIEDGGLYDEQLSFDEDAITVAELNANRDGMCVCVSTYKL